MHIRRRARTWCQARSFASGCLSTTTAGHALPSNRATQQSDGREVIVRECQRTDLAKEMRPGIKLNLSGGIMGPDWDRHWHSFLLQDELEAAFGICHLRGMKVMAHATNPEAVKDAVRLGAWTVEHGYIMDHDCIQMMKENGTIYVPTLGISHLTPTQVTTEWEREYLEARQIPDSWLERADAAVEEHGKAFRTALASGVKMALGSDLGPVKDAIHLEMGNWVRAGATSMQAIKAATNMSAETCGVSDKLGTVEVGKIADLIVVGADPLEDISNLRKLQLVFKNGKLAVDKTGRFELESKG